MLNGARKSVRRLLLFRVELVKAIASIQDIAYKSTLNFSKTFYYHSWIEQKRLCSGCFFLLNRKTKENASLSFRNVVIFVNHLDILWP